MNNKIENKIDNFKLFNEYHNSRIFEKNLQKQLAFDNSNDYRYYLQTNANNILDVINNTNNFKYNNINKYNLNK